MEERIFDQYRKKVFQYRYKFFLLGIGRKGTFGQHTHKGLEYRFRAEKELFHPSITEDMPDKVGEIFEEFVFKIDALMPEQHIKDALDDFKKAVLRDCQKIKSNEILRRANLRGSQILSQPPSVWDFVKKQDSDPEHAEKTFCEWDRILKAYEFTSIGKTKTDIIDRLMPEQYLPESDQPNRMAKLNTDLKKAKRLIESALNGTFPVLD